MTELTAERSRAPHLLAAGIAALAVVMLTLAPPAIVGPARAAFMRLMDAVTAPLVGWIPYGDAERLLNTALFVPLGATIAVLLARRAWPLAILSGFALSAAVEFAQTSIPGRVPDADDVLWNTVGCAIGVVMVTLPRLAAASVRRSRQRGRATRT